MAEKNRKAMLINVTHSEESRVAIVHDGVLEGFEIETFDHKALKGNIYKGRVESIHPGLQAAFVDIGGRKSAFLPLDEINFAIHEPRKDAQRGRIESHLHKGQDLLVQVVRDAFATKPPTVSTYFSLPGRFLVLTPHQEAIGISRKLEDKQRDKLRETIESLAKPAEHGVIVRTAGASSTKVDLQRDLKYLLRLWEKIETAAATTRPPALVYQERSLVIRAVRDLLTPDIDELLVDNRETYEEILEFFETVSPHRKKMVKLYEGERPIFNKHNLEEQIENIFRRRVPLPSGGQLVFDVTEALTAVDVNSSKMRKEGHIEDTALKANVEAAEEIARQLRLRDMGGLVVIDFIDMRAMKNVRQVEKVMKDALKKDKARYDVTRISSLGLMEISRERVAAEKSSLRYTDCPTCAGTGSIKTVEAAAMQTLRRLQTRVVKGDLETVEVTVPLIVAEYLLNQKRDDLVGWEERYRTRITVRASLEMGRDDCDIQTVTRERAREEVALVAPPSQSEVLAGMREDEERERQIAEAAAASAAAAAAERGEGAGDEAASGNGEIKKKRRRRRRRRKPGQGEAAVSATGEAGADAEGYEDEDSGPVFASDEDDEEREAGAHDDDDGAAADDDTGALAATGADGAAAEPSRKKRRRRRRKKKTNGTDAAQAQPTPVILDPAASTYAAAPSSAAVSPLAAHAPSEELEPPGQRPRPLWWRVLGGFVAEAPSAGQPAAARSHSQVALLEDRDDAVSETDFDVDDGFELDDDFADAEDDVAPLGEADADADDDADDEAGATAAVDLDAEDYATEVIDDER